VREKYYWLSEKVRAAATHGPQEPHRHLVATSCGDEVQGEVGGGVEVERLGVCSSLVQRATRGLAGAEHIFFPYRYISSLSKTQNDSRAPFLL